MLARDPRLACLFVASLLAACGTDPGPTHQGDGSASEPGGKDGGGDARIARDRDPEGGPATGDGGRDAARDADDPDANVDGGPSQLPVPHVLLRRAPEVGSGFELHAVAPDATHWRIHQALTAAGPFATPEVEGYLPAPNRGRVLVETLDTSRDGLHLAALETETAVPLEATTDSPSDLHALAFVDSDRVLVDGPGTTGRRLSTLDLDARTLAWLTPDGVALGAHALAPTAGEVAYLATTAPGPTRLYTVNLDGDATRDLSQGLGGASVVDFVWSRTSTWVAMFVEDGPAPSVWLVGRPGNSPAVKLADPVDGGHVETEGVTFSHDDSRVLYVERHARRELRSSTPTGNDTDVLSDSLTGRFAVSRANAWVCYFERDTLGDVSAHLVRTNGEGERTVRLSGSLAQGNACTFDDQGQVVIGFASNDSSAPWVHVLSSRTTHSLAVDGFVSTRWLGLSPTGRHALVEGRDGTTSEGELFVFDLEDPSAPPRELGRVPRPQQIESAAVGTGLRWSASGQFLYFLDGGAGARVLTRVAVADGTRERLEPQGAIADFTLLEDCCAP